MALSGESNNGGNVSGSGSALNADVISVDVTFIENIFVQITGTFSATATFQGSNDGTNWVNVLATDASNANTAPFSSATSAGIYIVPCNFTFFRLRLTAYSSGTVLANALITENSPLPLINRTVTVSSATITPSNILKQSEVTVSVKTETDLPSSTYTVPTAKTFSVTTFGGSYDSQQPMYIRLKKQTGGAGAFVTIYRITLAVNGQDASNFSVAFPTGALIGTAGDVFKVTYEAAVGRGTLWAGFTGTET